MRTKLMLLALALLVFASPMFGQTQGGGAADNHHWLWITAGFSMAIASAVCALGQGKAVAAACEAAARNPGAAGAIRLFLILGLALIESLALYVLVVIFMKVA